MEREGGETEGVCVERGRGERVCGQRAEREGVCECVESSWVII